MYALAWSPTSVAQVAVHGSLARDHDVAPGRTYQKTVVVENTTAKPVQARLKLRDYSFTYEGRNEFSTPGTVARSNASWIDLSRSVITIPPNQKEAVEYRVGVPKQIDGSKPVGTYWSILLVEPVPRGSAISEYSSTGEEPEFGVRQVTRYGVQVATHVRGSGTPKMTVAQSRLARRDSTPQLVLDMKNVGTRMARPEVKLETYSENGKVTLRESAAPMRVYPNTSVRYRLPLSGLEAGKHEAMIIVDAGGKQVSGFQYTLEL